MAATKTYFRDHFVLFLLTVNTFVAIFATTYVFLKLYSLHGNSYIVQYRSNLGVSAFKTGSIVSLISFGVFALMILVINAVLSFKTYNVNRSLSITVLCLGLMLTILDIIVSNALLVLH